MASTTKFFVNKPSDDEIRRLYLIEYFGREEKIIPKEIIDRTDILWTSQFEGRLRVSNYFGERLVTSKIYDFYYRNYQFFIQWSSGKELEYSYVTPYSDFRLDPDIKYSL